MCGLIGYVGARPAKELVLAGLERLEYRGYDSAGICVVESHGLANVRAVGNLERLRTQVNGSRPLATTALGHTRWATHGRVSVENAHPLAGCDEKEVAVALNGIIENFQELRDELAAEGHVFRSETDAETIAHLVERHYEGDLVSAVRAAHAELEGHFAFAVVHRDHPSLLVGARRHCPLVVGLGDGETFLASMIAAFLAETREAAVVEDGDVVAISPDGARFFSLAGDEVEREAVTVDWDDETALKQGHETFMLKEIHEQPQAVARTIAGRTRRGVSLLDEAGLGEVDVRELRRIVLVACGTAYHAGVSARYAIEEWARILCDADIASEWRYRRPILDEHTLVVGISQSGETADTLAALRLARASGAPTLAITNMMGTQITREADGVLFTRAGIEMGVAATKTFTAQVALLLLLALELAQERGEISASDHSELLRALESLPDMIASFLDGAHPVDEIAERYADRPFFLYLGRNTGLPVCLEGALKLKEISYIPTEAYSAGEMKHGPIALLDEETPVVCVATNSGVYEKMISNMQEVRARGAQVIAVATHGNEPIQHLVEDVVYVPDTHPFLQAILAVVPLQLLAYRIARLRGLDVDRPRNLAKTVTVE
ncbi:MAG: glutamine--fructose-6-phosphate transaminase (isomerizing) [Actinomycetota bacterium]|nr:glutamine--fructose-6-phosphate transaminase (isomerizing) [Actinomycetota bacterium]